MTGLSAKPTHANRDLPPGNRWALQNIGEILTDAPVSRGTGPVLKLPTALADLSRIPVRCLDGTDRTVNAVLDRTYTDGFLVIHRERIVVERRSGSRSGGSACTCT